MVRNSGPELNKGLSFGSKIQTGPDYSRRSVPYTSPDQHFGPQPGRKFRNSRNESQRPGMWFNQVSVDTHVRGLSAPCPRFSKKTFRCLRLCPRMRAVTGVHRSLGSTNLQVWTKFSRLRKKFGPFPRKIFGPYGMDHTRPLKWGCVLPIVISSEFHMEQYRDDHREDAPYFNDLFLIFLKDIFENSFW